MVQGKEVEKRNKGKCLKANRETEGEVVKWGKKNEKERAEKRNVMKTSES